jgi:DNA polymerase
MNSEEILKQVAQEVTVCKKCILHNSRKRAVPGEGPANAPIMFIGEGPGFYENESGRPFVGQAGKFLEELLAGIGLKREDVFIANVVKCRPPANRDPLPDELTACSDYLERQIQAINPPVIVTLGRFSMARFLPNAKISDVHGQAYHIKDRSSSDENVRTRLIVPMFHPAAALHQPSLRPMVERDFSRLPELIAQAKAAGGQIPDAPVYEEKQPENKPEPKQLSLF